jgi:hypothetical protein
MVKYISFDIGIVNLAYCYSNEEEIIDWGVFDIKGKDVNDTTENCMKVLHNAFKDIEYDIVLIENQPVQKNPKMKTIQIIVYSFFLYEKVIFKKDTKIYFVSANNKNKYTNKYEINIVCASKYIQNKKRAVECTKLILKDNIEKLDFFMKHKKKDDLADSYLQLLSYINYTPVLPNPPSPRSVVSSSSTSTTSDSEICLRSN